MLQRAAIDDGTRYFIASSYVYIYICLSLMEGSHQIRPVYVGSWKNFVSMVDFCFLN